MPSDRRLPIRVVFPSAEDHFRPAGGGGERKIFGDGVSPERREELGRELAAMAAHFTSAFRGEPAVPAVGKVRLRDDALAKSHRPTALFSSDTCPIIGGGAFGELFVSVRPDGFQRLREEVRGGSTSQLLANLSTLSSLRAYDAFEETTEDARQETRAAARAGQPLKVKLFRHGDPRLDQALEAAFQRRVRDLGIGRAEPLRYSSSLTLFRLSGVPAEAVDPILRFVGTQRLSAIPKFGILQSQSVPQRPAKPDDLPEPGTDEQFGIVGVVDSGVSPSDLLLAKWIHGRVERVPPKLRDHGHGSFVAGLVAGSRALNGNDPDFPSARARVLDVMVMPGTELLDEDQLIAVLDEVVPQHPDVRVWNLSLGTNTPCVDAEFSDLAIALDDIQERNDVLFVLAAGNYGSPPFRSWPPVPSLGETDRIGPPADSVRSVTVGSVAHLARSTSRVKVGEPSPFSRRGPGPAFTPKPEVVHFGGNCDAKAEFTQTGVRSLDGTGSVAEDVGTSFAAPLVSAVLADLNSALAEKPSRALLKALLVHSAAMRLNLEASDHIRYHGFGRPKDTDQVLACSPSSVTLLFDLELRPGFEYEKRNFPIPQCMRTADGRVVGDFLMTLAYDPPLNQKDGAEYCRANVDVSLGTYSVATDGTPNHKKQIPAEPADLQKTFEKNLIEHGFKWSPVKVYRRSIPNGVASSEWRLKLELLHRSGVVDPPPQRVVLLVTMSDPSGAGPVYDDVVKEMSKLGWATATLAVRDRIRVRP